MQAPEGSLVRRYVLARLAELEAELAALTAAPDVAVAHDETVLLRHAQAELLVALASMDPEPPNLN